MNTTLRCDLGALIRLTATWTDPDTNLPVDPTTVKFGFRAPSGRVVEKTHNIDEEVTRVSAGVYRFTFSATEAGTYDVRAWSTGIGQAAQTGQVEVKKNPLA